MSQTKKQSMIETLSNTFIGMMGSWSITMVVLYFTTSPLMIATVTTILCTIWSIARGYTVRRYFANKHEAANEQTQ